MATDLDTRKAYVAGLRALTPRAAGAIHLTPAERAAVEAYLARLTRNVRDLANRLERLRADLREPASPPRLPGLSGVRPEHPIHDTSQSGVAKGSGRDKHPAGRG